MVSGVGIKQVVEKLSGLDSFVAERFEGIGARALGIIPEDETILGTYVNNADDFFVVTVKGLHCIQQGKSQFLPYALISAVELPDDETYRDIALRLHDGDVFYLKIANDTEEFPDLHPVHEALSSIVHWPLVRNYIDEIRSVETREDLVRFVDYIQNERATLDPVSSVALNRGFPSAFQLQQLNIDCDLLNKPDTWRLLALVLAMRRTYNDKW
jgi:hypothetical protein